MIQGTASEALLVAMLASRARAIRRMVKSMAHEEALDHVLTHMVVYSSDQAHSCMKKAAMICGIPDCRYRAIGVDENFAMRVDELELAIEVLFPRLSLTVFRFLDHDFACTVIC